MLGVDSERRRSLGHETGTNCHDFQARSRERETPCRKLCGAAATVCGLTAGTALAQAPSQSPGEGLAVEVGDCVKLQSPAERFECYEKQVDAAQRERAEPGAVVTPPAPAAAAPAAAAAAAPAAAAPAAAPASAAATAVVLQAEPTEFAGTISALREIEPRNYLITLDNGQGLAPDQVRVLPAPSRPTSQGLTDALGLGLSSIDRRNERLHAGPAGPVAFAPSVTPTDTVLA